MEVVHYIGKTVSEDAKELNPYLHARLDNKCLCGYLLLKIQSKLMTKNKDLVTCKNCIKILID